MDGPSPSSRSSPPPPAVSSGGGLGRQALKLAFAVLVFAAVIARLRRVPRPRFEPEREFAAGVLGFGRVVLARPSTPLGSEPGALLGWAVVCRGREVLSRAGPAALELTEGNDGYLRVREAGGPGTPGRVATVRASDCRVDWAAAPPAP